MDDFDRDIAGSPFPIARRQQLEARLFRMVNSNVEFLCLLMKMVLSRLLIEGAFWVTHVRLADDG